MSETQFTPTNKFRWFLTPQTGERNFLTLSMQDNKSGETSTGWELQQLWTNKGSVGLDSKEEWRPVPIEIQAGKIS